MNTFSIQLRSATQDQVIEHVSTFVGEDETGCFGLLPGHHRMITTLTAGLARYRLGEQQWQFIACPSAVLYFRDNVLQLSTRRYVLGSDFQSISQSLAEDILAEEEKLHSLKQSLIRLEGEMLHRLWHLNQEI